MSRLQTHADVGKMIVKQPKKQIVAQKMGQKRLCCIYFHCLIMYSPVTSSPGTFGHFTKNTIKAKYAKCWGTFYAKGKRTNIVFIKWKKLFFFGQTSNECLHDLHSCPISRLTVLVLTNIYFNVYIKYLQLIWVPRYYFGRCHIPQFLLNFPANTITYNVLNR